MGYSHRDIIEIRLRELFSGARSRKTASSKHVSGRSVFVHEIICPHCDKAFKIDEAGYADILKQVRDHEFDLQWTPSLGPLSRLGKGLPCVG